VTSDRYHPALGSYGTTVENEMNGSDDGKDQINSDSVDNKSTEYEEIPSEKSLEHMFDKGGC
jgi:hypothetical protein